MKKLIFVLIVAILVCGCATNHRGLTSQEKEVARGLIGQSYYTLANIWFPEPNLTWSHNIHTGDIMPLGTKVKINRCEGAQIKFSDEKGIIYTMVLSRKSLITLMNQFDRYFSKNNVLDSGGAYYNFTEQEQKNIKNREIDYGMSKESVIMAYGYPPPSVGWYPSIQNNVWEYFEQDGLHLTKVFFRDNKVIKLESIKKGAHIPIVGRREKATVIGNANQKNISEQSNSNFEEIRKYKKLLDEGIITQLEFEKKKKQLLEL